MIRQTDSTYRERVLELLGEREPMEVLEETPAALGGLVSDHRPEVMRARPCADKWTSNEILGHLADAEWVFGYRLRAILTESRPALPPFDQDRWVERSGHNERRPADLLGLFGALREFNLMLWEALTPADLHRSGVHETRGEETLELMRRITAGHDLCHLAQMTRCLEVIEKRG